MHKIGSILWIVLLFLTACNPSPAPDPNTNSLHLTPCLASSPGQAGQIAAQCADLPVPEDYANPSGVQIPIHVVVIPAQSANPAPDPVFLLAGGPGQAASQVYPGLVSTLQKISFKHDIVLMDQRGTGGSAPLHCPVDPSNPVSELDFPSPADVTAFYQDCLANLKQNPLHYTTAAFVRDLEAVRSALGYAQINLIGVSYGTRSGMEYLRAYPQNVRTIILDGLAPPGWFIGEAMRRDAQSAMDDIFRRCAADPACAAAFPELPSKLTSLLDSLARQPQEVTLPHPLTGKSVTYTLNDFGAGSMLRMISYSSAYSALIPWLVNTAAEGNLVPLAAQFLIASSEEGVGLEAGLFYAVFCAEDLPYLKDEGDVRSFFPDPLPFQRAACAAYPANEQPPQPYPRDLPTPALLISGGADPITPPSNGEEAASLLGNSRHIVLPGMGHGNLTAGCIPNLAAQFIDTADPQALDLSCTERIQPPPFFLSPLGPEP